MAALFDDDHPIKRLQEAELLFMSGRFSDAARGFRALRGDRLTGANARRRLAYIALLAGHTGNAERRLRHLPREPESLRLSAALFRRTGQLATAASCVRALGDDLMAHSLGRLSERPLAFDDDRTVRCPLSALSPLPLLEGQANGRPVTLLLDTGSQEVVLDAELVERLGLWRSALQQGVFAGGRQGGLRYGRLDELRLGDGRFRNLPVQVQPLRPTFERMFDGRGVDGILGTSLLSRFFVEVDFAGGELRLAPADAGSRMPHRFWLADAFLPLVRATVNGVTALPMLLDTGQQGFAAALSAETARAARLPIADLPVAGEGGGGEVTVLPTRLDTLQVAGVTLEAPPAVCMPRFGLERRFGFRVGGMIGYEAVRGRVLSMDFQRMRIALSERRDRTAVERDKSDR